MSLRTCLFLGCFLFMQTVVFGQRKLLFFGQKKVLDRRISVNIQGESLQEALVVVSAKGKFNYSYNPSILSLEKKVTLVARKKTIEEILTKLIDNPSIVIDEYKNQVIIRKIKLHDSKSLKVNDNSLNKKLTKISGEILDSLSNEPVVFAHIYIANTMIGATTDTLGRFSLNNIPFGNFEIFVSHLNYKVITLKITEDKLLPNMTIYLSNKIVNLEAVDVISSKDKDKEWQKYFKKFEKHFFGTSKNALKCEIMNPWVIDFVEDAHGTLTASASELLIIENRALGYKVSYLLENFEVNSSQSNIYLNYSGKSRFEHLDNKISRKRRRKAKRRRQEANKVKAYQGSLVHFFYALRTNSLKADGFLVKVATSDSIVIAGSDRYVGINKLKETALSSDSVYRLFQRMTDISPSLLLEVNYIKEKEEYNYASWLNKEHKDVTTALQERVKRSKYQTSKVLINKILIHPKNGEIPYHTYSVTVYGYWAWLGFAEALPISYRPKKTNN